MKIAICITIGAALFAAASSTMADSELQGHSLNGSNQQGVIMPNGTSLQGLSPNGSNQQGVVMPNGTSLQGLSPNGSNRQGLSPQGHSPNGSNRQGINPNGSNRQGADPNGDSQQGVMPNGATLPGDTQPSRSETTSTGVKLRAVHVVGGQLFSGDALSRKPTHD